MDKKLEKELRELDNKNEKVKVITNRKGKKVIARANQKGGVGKTTTSVNSAAYLNDMDNKTLLIDTDGQYNSTDTRQAVETTLFNVLYTNIFT